EGGIEEVVGCGALCQGIGVVARFHLRRSGVAVACPGKERTALRIDRGRLPDRVTAISTRLAAVLGDGEGLPEDLAALLVERHHAAAERTARDTPDPPSRIPRSKRRRCKRRPGIRQGIR